MSTTKAMGRDASVGHGGVLFQAFNNLLKQREILDHEIMKLQGTLFDMLEKKAGTVESKEAQPPKKSKSDGRKKYVDRMENDFTLRDAIREAMVPGQNMRMKDILSKMKEKELYKTQSKHFYTMVNNKLHEDPKIKRVSTGVFCLNRRVGRPSKSA